MPGVSSLGLLLAALALDALAGEPPSWTHPVVWLGQLISWGERRHPSGPRNQLAYGALLALACIGLYAGTGWLLVRLAEGWPPLGLLLSIFLLKSTFSLRALAGSARQVGDLLASRHLGEARASLRSLVSRDASGLSREQAAAAAIESVAENLSDSFVAPLLYFCLFGLPGALAYRAVNTLDSVVGYRGDYEYLGKASARLDDLLNLVPSRLTALLIVAAAGVAHLRPGQAWRVMWRDHGLTASPNAGWPMSAMAGALGLELEKVGHYRLGAGGAAATPAHIDRSLRLLFVAVILSLPLFACLQLALRA